MTAITLAVMDPKSRGTLTPLWAILSAVALVAAIVFVVRPAILWTQSRAPKGKPMNEMFIISIFVLVPLMGFMSETIGQHYVFGPLVLGLAMPDGPPLGVAMISKLDTFASGLFYPTYLAISGLRTNIFKIHFQALGVVGLVVLFSCVVKIGAVMVPAVYSDVPVREAFVLGLIINARGIIELMIFNLWKDTLV
jgi:Kef-type K+ transport system membrane component KefB